MVYLTILVILVMINAYIIYYTLLYFLSVILNSTPCVAPCCHTP